MSTDGINLCFNKWKRRKKNRQSFILIIIIIITWHRLKRIGPIQLKCHSFIHSTVQSYRRDTILGLELNIEHFLFGVTRRIPIHFDIFHKFSRWPFWDSITKTKLKRRLLRIQLNSLAQLTVGMSKRKHVQCSVFNYYRERKRSNNVLLLLLKSFSWIWVGLWTQHVNTIPTQLVIFFVFVFPFYCCCCCWIVYDEILFYRNFHKPRFGL